MADPLQGKLVVILRRKTVILSRGKLVALCRGKAAGLSPRISIVPLWRKPTASLRRGNSIKSSRRFYRRVKPGNRCSRFRRFPFTRIPVFQTSPLSVGRLAHFSFAAIIVAARRSAPGTRPTRGKWIRRLELNAFSQSAGRPSQSTNLN